MRQEIFVAVSSPIIGLSNIIIFVKYILDFTIHKG